jgi:hypothetical protein
MSEEIVKNFYFEQAQIYLDAHPETLTIQNAAEGKRLLRDALQNLKEYPPNSTSHNRSVVAKIVTQIFTEQVPAIAPKTGETSGQQSIFKPQVLPTRRSKATASFGLVSAPTGKISKSVNGAKHIINQRAITDGVNLIVNDSGFQPSTDINDFSDLTDSIPPEEFEPYVLNFQIGEENAQEYYDILETAKNSTDILLSRHAVSKGKQVFKFDKAEGVYKRNSTDTVGEKVTCDDPEIEDLLKRDRLCEKVDKIWKERSKGLDFLEFFKIPQISCHNIIALKDLKPILTINKMQDVETNKFLNSMNTTDNCPLEQLEVITNKLAELNGSNATSYVTLFTDTLKANGTGLKSLIPNLFNHRVGIIHHRSVTVEFKQQCWLSARANIMTVDRDSLKNERERDVVDAWEKVLNSIFFYHIFMNGAAPCELVKKALKTLLIEGKSLHMYVAELYPISWVFTPLWCGFGGLNVKDIFTNENEYKTEIKGIFQKICNSDSKLIDFEYCNWLYCRDKNGRNVIAGLFCHQLENNSTEKPEKKTRK